MQSKAYNYCIYLLSRQDYPEGKLRSKMREKGYDEQTRDEVIERLHEFGYIREEAYIRTRIKSLLNKGYSAYYITQKLSEENLNVTINEIEDLYVELDFNLNSSIEKLIEKKLRSLTKETDKQKKREKIVRFLASKGHRIDFSVIEKFL
jgi:regulatory protein